MSRVVIGIPANGDMKVMTACCLVMATNLVRTVGHDLDLVYSPGPYTHWNREHLVQSALETDADYLMFIDTDVTFPPDGIARLIDDDKDIVGAMYNLKQPEPVTTIKMWNEDRSEFRAVKDEPLPAELFQVAALPTGFMLIRLACLARMAFPYFPCEFGRGEDVAFCLNAQEVGLEVWCDPTIEVKHLGDYAY